MPRIILLLLAAFALWYGWQYFRARPQQDRKRIIWVWGGVALVVISVILVATGRMHWIGVAIASLIPLVQTAIRWLPRLFPLAGLLGKKLGPSTLTTRGLKVVFNFASGDDNGEIFSGPYSGTSLNGLDEKQLNEQLTYFNQNDRQSALLLQAYMLRRGFSGHSSRQDSYDSRESSASMSEEEARLILGVTPGASRDDILRAHKRLIQKLHPDRGGNEYLAAKINAARDKLVT